MRTFRGVAVRALVWCGRLMALAVLLLVGVFCMSSGIQACAGSPFAGTALVVLSIVCFRLAARLWNRLA